MKAFERAHVTEFRVYARPFRIEQPKQVKSSGPVGHSAYIGDFDGLFPQRRERLEILVAAHLVFLVRQFEFSRQPVARRLIVLSCRVFFRVRDVTGQVVIDATSVAADGAP